MMTWASVYSTDLTDICSPACVLSSNSSIISVFLLRYERVNIHKGSGIHMSRFGVNPDA
jgi:hypothetical protein